MSSSSADLRRKLDELQGAGAYWAPTLDPLIDRAPSFVEAYLAMAGHPWRSNHLSPKTRHLVSLSLYAAVTHLYGPGIRHHCRGAIDAGASVDEIIEVLQLASNLGVHACVLAVPILQEKLASIPEEAKKLARNDARRVRLKEEFISSRGYWSGIWDGLLALDPDYFEAFTTFSSVPWRSKALDATVKEFVYIATDVSVTHQFSLGTHIHIENALKYGATAEQILEVIQLASTMGISTFEAALPVVAEELARRAAAEPDP
ncbi:carboxymuconolactone decarboxylase family protein [Bosea sp. (in: a-proteobacteria)]|jgi:alkylhydroperoxidase/carboxymuconolactone decarboxylase family protein YurZ|uniref:carboxymuconolactone decarboxylase family protein n=1 Tax=Bosea sp. (in: a-proteobacteria) TaxID=1871050 RepID=UPI0009E75ECB